jgi:hypothetical protein
MDVFQLRPKSRHGYCGGMALVAAPYFAAAVDEYSINGSYAEEYVCGEFTFQEASSIQGLDWHGGVSIICDSMYFE